MIDDVRPRQRPPDRRRIAQVAFASISTPWLRRKAALLGERTSDPHTLAGRAQLLRDVAAQLPRRSGHHIDFVAVHWVITSRTVGWWGGFSGGMK